MLRGLQLMMKTVRIFSDRIRDRIRLEGSRSVRIRVRIFNIRYRIRIQIPKSHIYDVDIQLYLIRHGWYYSYSNPNPSRNTKLNVISAISIRIRSVFIPSCSTWWYVQRLAKICKCVVSSQSVLTEWATVADDVRQDEIEQKLQIQGLNQPFW
jgi:hypothetical protein